MEITSKIFRWIEILKVRPKMIIAGNTDYRNLKIYIEGYIDGIGHVYNKDIRKTITRWFQNKVKQQRSIYWTDHIPDYYKDKSEEELKAILLQTLEDYFKENPEWYKSEEEEKVG